jgi:hypothetical protein
MVRRAMFRTRMSVNRRTPLHSKEEKICQDENVEFSHFGDFFSSLLVMEHFVSG